MGQYHYLIAGLPDITLDDSKQVYSVCSFKEEVVDQLLTSGDRNLMRLFFLKYDNQDLLRWLDDPEVEFDKRGTFTNEDFEKLVSLLKNGKRTPYKTPAYIINFLKKYLAEVEAEAEKENEEQQPVVASEDVLSALYYAYAMKNGNTFFSEWFEMNLNIKNVFTAMACRKHGLDRNLYVLGDNSIADALRTSGARDFNLGDEIAYLPALFRLAEDTDLLMREKKIDLLKWEWLEDNTIFKIFGIENVFAYLLKLEMIERWTNLDKGVGENTFRGLIRAMKKDSNSALENFKKNNKR